MDPANTNAQNSNARSLLSRFSDLRARWTVVCSEHVADSLHKNGIQAIRLPNSRLWQYCLAVAYQSKFDAIFYPGPHWGDEIGIKIRDLLGTRTPAIATLEGIIAPPESVQRFADYIGHPVFSQPGTEAGIPRIKWMYERADHIVAISPFLARFGKFLYGDKVSHLPLGVEADIFYNEGRREPARCRVVSCGTVKHSKNPRTFLSLAARYREADFVWFGEGPMVQTLTQEAQKRGLGNLHFAGPVPPKQLAEEFRNSSLLTVTSRSEGVPKVTQEAAACGLPIVLYGFYEAPTVVHELNGLVAWSEEELITKVGTLINAPDARARMGQESADMAKEWDWDRIAPQWENFIIRHVKAS
jgi:glycosyltransferase involved in cell wall biosynthesis